MVGVWFDFFMEEGGKINRNFGISAAKILFNLQRAKQSVFLCSHRFQLLLSSYRKL